MASLRFLLLLLVTFATACAEPITVMSYNIRYDTASDGVNQWSNRKDRVAALILVVAILIGATNGTATGDGFAGAGLLNILVVVAGATVVVGAAVVVVSSSASLAHAAAPASQRRRRRRASTRRRRQCRRADRPGRRSAAQYPVAVEQRHRGRP